MATKTAATVKTFFPRIEKTIPAEVQRHLQLIYLKLGNHTTAFGEMTNKLQGTAAAVKTAAAQRVVGGSESSTTVIQVPPFAYKAVVTAYNVVVGDYQIEALTGTFTITLPDSTGAIGTIYSIKNSGTGTITVATTASQTIDGSLTQSLTRYDNLTVFSNNFNWIIV